MTLSKLVEKFEKPADEWHAPEAEPKYVRVTWQGKEWAGLLRIMDVDEVLDRDRRLALWIGNAAVGAMPNYIYWRALATIKTLWPDLPPWMDWFVSKMKGAAIDIADRVDRYEAKFLRDHVGAGGTDAATSGFSVSADDDDEEVTPVGGGE